MNRENQANALRVDSATLSDRARDLDVPDELSDAQDYFVEALDLRRDALAEVADELPGALATEERRNSTGRIAEMMQVFLASDVLLEARFEPSATERPEEGGREREDRQGVSCPSSRTSSGSTPTSWPTRSPAFAGPTAAAPLRASHGNGLGTVSLGGVALTPGGSATVPLTSDIAFDVQVVNQGESTETDVNVEVTVGPGRRRDQGGGDDPRDRRRRGQERDDPAHQAAPDRARTCRSP